MIIYKITNKLNGKSYIGQTTQTLSQRWYQHKYNSKDKDTKLARAIRKYGISNFSISTIYETDNYEDLNKMEEIFISQYNTTKKGYNIRTGGANSPRSEETKRKLSESRKGKKNPYVKKSNQRRKGEKRNNTGYIGNTNSRKAVLCTTNNIQYPSITSAAKDLDISRRSIQAVLKGEFQSVKGYTFIYI